MDVDRKRGLDARDWTFHRLSDVGWTMSLVVRDMNRDGRADILLSDRRGPLAGVRWLEHPGFDSPELTRPWKNHWIGARGREAMLLDAADPDGDGTSEIVVPHYLADHYRLSIFRMDRAASAGETWTEYPIEYPTIAGLPKAAAVGDIDLDGRPDIVLSAEQARGEKRGIVWLRCRHSPFEPAWDAFDVSGPQGVKFDLNLLLDVDADGDLDILKTEENDNAAGSNPGLGLVWYENPTRGILQPRRN
jgi:hypothetical protein